MSENFETKYNNLFLEIYSNLKALELSVIDQEQFIQLVKKVINNN